MATSSQGESCGAVHVSAKSATRLTHCPSGRMVMDTGATHCLHNKRGDFCTFRPLVGKHVTMPDESRIPITGIGDVIIEIQGRLIYLRNVYFVPSLRVPLYSLRIHRRLPNCGHFADNSGFYIKFPTFNIEVDDEIDSFVTYSSASTSDVRSFDYVQPTPREIAFGITAAASRVTPGVPLRCSPRLAQSTNQPSPTWADVVSGDKDEDFDALDDEDVVELSPSNTDGASDLNEEALGLIEHEEALDSAEYESSVSSDTSGVSDSANCDGGSCDPSEVDSCPLDSSDLKSCREEAEVKSTPSPDDTPRNGSSSSIQRISMDDLLKFSSDPSLPAPPVRPCDTPNASDTVTTLTSDRIYRSMGNRRFRSYDRFGQVLQNAKYINSGEPLQSLGEFANLKRRRRGKVLPPSKKYLDKVHMDIVYGDVISKLGFRYGLLLIDRATKYIWFYGLKSLSSDNIIAALEQFQADAGGLPTEFRCDCDQKLLGGATRRWIYRNKSKIIGAPAGRQSSNGLVERAWQTLRNMARAYLTEAGMPRDYWYFAIAHAARMMNMTPGNMSGKITTPFELVHRVAPDVRTWIPLFSIVYFHLNNTDGDAASFDSDAMIGIAVGRSDKTNGLKVYNPSTKNYYEPYSYKFDPSRRPSSEWPRIQYDGGLYVDLYHDSHHNNVPEPYPPGTPFKLSREDGSFVNAIVSSIPVRTEEGDTVPDQYRLHCPDGSTVTKSLAEMDELSETPANKSVNSRSALPMVDSLPIWLQHKSKVSMFRDGKYHKGYIVMSSAGSFRFSCRRQMSSRQESWGVNLPNFESDWPRLTCDNILLPTWNTQGYSKHGLVPSSTPFDPSGSFVSASHISAKGLKSDCPKSLKEALSEDNVDRDIWLQSYYEEKRALVDNHTYVTLTLEQYRELRRTKNAPKAIPTMCVQTVKKDENLLPERAKSRIVVLGNLEDRYWSKSERYAPVLQYSSLRLLTSMAVEKTRRLKQGDYKNAFVQATLPDDELTIVRPPLGDPDADLDESGFSNPHSTDYNEPPVTGSKRCPRPCKIWV